MQINNPYINRMRDSVSHGLFLAILCLFSSCSEEETIRPNQSNDCQVTLGLNVSSFEQQGGGITRSLEPDNPDENRIKDIWIFQYDAETGESLKTPVYIDDFNSNDIRIGLEPNGPDQKSLVCIVANTHQRGWALDDNGNTSVDFDTYEKLKNQPLPIEVSNAFLASNMGENGRTVPMFGVSKEMAIVSKCYVSIPLKRMFARVRVSMDLSYLTELNMEIKNIKFFNIPVYSRIETIDPTEGDDQAATYPSGISWQTYDAGVVSEVILFVPENLQGKVSAMTSKQTASENLFPLHALKVQITIGAIPPNKGDDGTDNTSSDDPQIYTIYPGLDMLNDFNIKRNYIYDVTVKIKQDIP